MLLTLQVTNRYKFTDRKLYIYLFLIRKMSFEQVPLSVFIATLKCKSWLASVSLDLYYLYEWLNEFKY